MIPNNTFLLIIFTITILLNSTNKLHCQNSSISIVLGIDKTHRIYKIDNNAGSPLGMLVLSEQESIENKRSRFRTNYKLGIDYKQKVIKNFSIKTGVRISSLGFNTGYERLKPEDYTINVTDPATGSNIAIGLSYSSLLYRDYLNIEIPFILNMNFDKQKLSHFLEFGIGNNINFAYFEKFQEFELDYIKRLNSEIIGNLRFSLILSYGITYKFSEKGELFLQALSRYYLNYYSPESHKLNYYNFGIEYGYRFNFNWKKHR